MGIVDDLGQGIGGLFKSPGILAISALAIGLFIFRKPIQEAFSNFGGSISNLFSPSGIIQGAGEQAGQFVFNIGQDVGGAVFDAGAAAGGAVFDAGAAFGEFVGETQAGIDQQLQNFFKVQENNLQNFFSNFPKDVQEGFASIPKSALKAAEEGGPFSGLFDFFSGLGDQAKTPLLELPFQGPSIFPQTGESTFLDPDRPLDLFSFAEQFKITPAEAFGIEKAFGGLDFEAIAAIPTFGEVLAENPQLTASQIANLKFIQAGGGGDFDFGLNTGSAFDFAGANFGQGDVNIELLKQAQELISKTTLGGFVGGDLFGNPDFPITAGEAFLGESGTVVSPSITNLNEEQLKAFIEQFG